MRDLIRRLKCAEPEVAVELIRRGAFSKADLRELARDLKRPIRSKEPATRRRMEAKRAELLRAIVASGSRAPNPGFIAGLAHGDRQLAIHAVINGSLTGGELAQLGHLTDLQTDGHLLRQLRVAIELEIGRRRTGAARGASNRITGKRG